MQIHFYSSDMCMGHNPGHTHPDVPERVTAVRDALRKPEFKDFLIWKDAPLGTDEQLLLVHTLDYVNRIKKLKPKRGYVPLDSGDTVMSPGSYKAVMACVGGSCLAVDDVMTGKIKRAFVGTRPCGHHAVPDRAMGFAIFNHAAIAAFWAVKKHNIKRVALMDFDVHHGNGTQDMFYHHANLFYGSCHQSPFYPGTGAPYETGIDHNIVNVPLARSCNSQTFQTQMTQNMLPAIRRFNPELLIISAGFDAHQRDPLGGLNLTDNDFYWITKELVKIANESCDGKVVSILEGGYSLEGLATGVAAHVKALIED